MLTVRMSVSKARYSRGNALAFAGCAVRYTTGLSIEWELRDLSNLLETPYLWRI